MAIRASWPIVISFPCPLIRRREYDGDGLLNEFEWKWAWNQAHPQFISAPVLDSSKADSDDNYTTDGLEDFDNDGWNNLEEQAAGTSPHAADTDGDGMIDSEDPDPLYPPEGDDDGLPDSSMKRYANYTNPKDGVSTTVPDFATWDAKTVLDFTKRDTNAGRVLDSLEELDYDGDGLPDSFEIEYAHYPNSSVILLDYTKSDTDGDEVRDDWEDLDGDGLANWVEYQLRTSPLLADTNGDGILDNEEDPDGDRLVNWMECWLGTNPLLADTNGDGLPDGVKETSELFLGEASSTGTEVVVGFWNFNAEMMEYPLDRNYTLDFLAQNVETPDYDHDGIVERFRSAAMMEPRNPISRIIKCGIAISMDFPMARSWALMSWMLALSG